MAKKINNYTLEMSVVGEVTTARVRYEVGSTVDTDCKNYGELTYEIIDGNTVTVEKAAIEAAIEAAEGIS